MLWLVKAPLIASVAIAIGAEIWRRISDSDYSSYSPCSDSHSSPALVSRSPSPDDHSGTFSKSSTRVDSSNKKEVIKEIRVVEEKGAVEERIIRGSHANASLTLPKEGAKLRKQTKWIKHYCNFHKILLVGEGDFSFSACLAKAFGSADNIVATSLDSFGFLTGNYKNAISNISELESRGGIVRHGFDATMMADYFNTGRKIFDRIIYNFPHAGFSSRNEPKETQIREHRTLVTLFLQNAKKLIREDGEIHISHKSSGFFLEWNLKTLGSLCGLHLIEEEEMFRFVKAALIASIAAVVVAVAVGSEIWSWLSDNSSSAISDDHSSYNTESVGGSSSPNDDSSKYCNTSIMVHSSNKEVIEEKGVVEETEVVPKGAKLRKGKIGIKHYYSSHTILLVGEGDFSFSACLAKAFGSAHNMVATSLDSLVETKSWLECSWRMPRKWLTRMEKYTFLTNHVVSFLLGTWKHWHQIVAFL